MIRPPGPAHSSDAVQKIYDWVASPIPNFHFNWVPTLDAHLEKGGMIDVKLEKHPINPHLESFHNRLKLLTCAEALWLMPASEETQRLRKLLEEANAEMRCYGTGLTSSFVLALGMKPK